MPAKSKKNYEAITASGDSKISVERGNLNYLLRTKKIILNTQKNKEKYEERQRIKAVEMEKRIAEAKAISQSLTGCELTIELETDGEKLYNSINEKSISKYLLEQKNLEISYQCIMLSTPIKTIGKYNILIELEKNISNKILLIIVAKKKNLTSNK